jgi:regulator of sigma E protease
MHNAFINVVAVVLVLGFMILIHEWGHFVAARLLGVRVDVFSIGFGPRIFGFRRGPTDYRLSVLPFGGYVKMAGDNPIEERAGSSDEFLSKPRWQRVLIAVAGPTMNILFALVVTLALFMVGAPEAAYMSKPAQVAGVFPGSPAAQAGVQPGDLIVKVDARKTANWEDAIFETGVAPAGARIVLSVERNGIQEFLQLPSAPPQGTRDEYQLLGYPHTPVIVGTVVGGLPASKAGLKTDDRILSADGQPMLSPIQFATLVRNSDGKPVTVTVQPAGAASGTAAENLTLQPAYGDPGDGQKRWQIGISFGADNVYASHSFFDAANRSLRFNYRMTRQMLHVLAGLFQGKVSLKQLGGPVGIAPQLGEAARRSFLDLISLTAVISLNLGVLNLLPIPILDGGHVLMLAIEGLLRRDLSVTVKERFVQVGMVFLLGVIVFVTYYDILKLLPGR